MNAITQFELPIRSAPQVINPDLILNLKSFTDAIKLSVQISGFEEKQIYMELGIDAGHWTRMMNGGANFPQDKLTRLMDFVGNEIPLIWLAHKRGYELKRIQTDIEQENESLRIQVAQLESNQAVIQDFMKGINP